MANIQQRPERLPIVILQEALTNDKAYRNLRIVHPVGPPPDPGALLISDPAEANDAERLLQGMAPDGDRVLHIAARLEDVELVRAISVTERWLNAVDATAKNNREETALHCAAATGNVDMIGALLALLAEPEHDDRTRQLLREQKDNGETCLHEAVRCGKEDAVRILVQEDARVVLGPNDGRALVKITDEQGVSALYLATKLRQLEIVQLLTKEQEPAGTYPAASYDGPGRKTALHAAVLLGKDLSEHLAKWNNKELIGKEDLYGNTPLHLLASTSDKIIVKLLLDLDESAGYHADYEGSLPIHVAAANGSLEIVKLLSELRPGCAWSCNNFGQTILHIAVQERRYSVVNYVSSELKFERIFNIRDTDGNTALHMAVLQGHQHIFCQLMRRREVCLSFTNKEELTPLDLAQLSIPPNISSTAAPYLIMNSLIVAGADWGTYRRDHWARNLAKREEGKEPERIGHDHLARSMAKHEEEKESQTIGKSAGVLGVCAVLILTAAFAAPFAVAPFYDTNKEKSMAMRFAYRIFAMSDFGAFGFAAAAISSCTFAGFPFLDRTKRFLYFSTGYLFLLFAAMFMILVFMGGVYLAVRPVVDSATLAYVYLPGVLYPSALLLIRALGSRLLLHMWALTLRLGYPGWFCALPCLLPPPHRGRDHISRALCEMLVQVLFLFHSVHSSGGACTTVGQDEYTSTL
ncbi:hypothetical protein CFC21_024444, partial [Triticum aestivum]